ncbi:conserved hypothetical protein [Neospora caninum Liverpool]|uniref:Uncharacterized protein n=1 Tax=Neospora caninum (strain Liverpool) TaxID=572307 RepID=F0VBY6_NEOCL|nr:conserved hypothetical protein [Neospora caninum Liverpool]CBZ51120.1 conserved hypothetical protein [Neospora caninum Liverpool]CEL68428.1 TPA: hypothetical protein BN1204_041950 [Neospora caninum Liverpool]|eukprot:XP_003881153.1 conserved hypothetical protein [Neospora caninum Liverpool]
MTSQIPAATRAAPSIRPQGVPLGEVSRPTHEQDAWLCRVFTRALLHCFWSSSNSAFQRTLRDRIKSKNRFREKCEALGQCLMRIGGAAAAATLKPLQHPAFMAAVVDVGSHEFFRRFMFESGNADSLPHDLDEDLSFTSSAAQPKYGARRLFAVPYVTLRDSSRGDAVVHLRLDNVEKERPEADTDCGTCIVQSCDAEDRVHQRSRENEDIPFSDLTLGQLQELVGHGQLYLSVVEQQLRNFWTFAPHIKLLLQQHAQSSQQISGTDKPAAVSNETAQTGMAEERGVKAEVSGSGGLSDVLRCLHCVNDTGLTPEAVLGLRRSHQQTERADDHDACPGVACGASGGLQTCDQHKGPGGADGEMTVISGNGRSLIPQNLSTNENLPCFSVRHVQPHSTGHNEIGHPSGFPRRPRESVSQPDVPPMSSSPESWRHRPVVSLAELGDLSALEREPGGRTTQKDTQWRRKAPASGELEAGGNIGGVMVRTTTEPSVLSVDSSSDAAEKPGNKVSRVTDGNGPNTDEAATEASRDERAVIAGGKELEEICDAVYLESLRLQELVAFYEDFAAECLQRQGLEYGAARSGNNECDRSKGLGRSTDYT